MKLKQSQKIGVIGLWHLGSVLCASWAKLGFQVVGFDYDKDRVSSLSKGLPPVFEPNLKETIKKFVAKGTLNFSNTLEDLKECDFILLSYDTPVSDTDSSDLTILKKSVNDIKNIMKDNSILIVSSQSPAGYCSILRKNLQDQNDTLELAYSPENLRLGEAIDCYLNPGRIILGTQNNSTEKRCRSLFENITNHITAMNLESSEMVKHGINSFLATSVVFANHLSDICEQTGANIDDVIGGIKSDPRIGEKAYLSPGIGFSGGTLGRDLKVLEKFNRTFAGPAKLFSFIHYTNLQRKNTIKDKIIELLKNSVGEASVGVLGLTYKPGTSTLRRSLPLDIVNLLVDEGIKVKAYDPKADYSEMSDNPKFIVTNSVKEVSVGVDMLVLLTEWPEFKEFDWLDIKDSLGANIIFDTKNCLDGKSLKDKGFEYYSLGKPSL
jgi:UDPglucose 6-dehydrogenase